MALFLHMYKGSPTSGGTDGTQVSEHVETTVSGTNSSGQAVLNVADASKLVAGRVLKIGTGGSQEIRIIQSIATNAITLTENLTYTHSNAEAVVTNEEAPLSVTLNATNNEISTDQKLALRCETGYTTTGNTVITPTGTSAAKWALAPDNAGSPGTYGAYGAALTITDAIGATNKLFWAKAKSTSDEIPVNDITVNFNLTATIAAV